ncbi:MAG: HAMP domain-containing sensor histidine kinase, partial [Catalinimonas sp.]
MISTRTLRLIVVLATLSIFGIVATQVYWVRRAFSLQEKQFDQTVHIALRDAAARVVAFNGHRALPPDLVSQVASDYYVVNVNDALDAPVLEHFLREAFNRHDLYIDYEYGIYDCATDRMVYGDYVSRDAGAPTATPHGNLPKWEGYVYYFGVRFPARDSYLVGQMGLWMLSSGLLLVVAGFFGYVSFVVLRQRRLQEVQRDFINMMTHELKTPIATIALSTDALGRPEVAECPARLRTYVGIVRQENERLQQQVERVLRLARFDRHRVPLQREELALDALVREVCDLFRLKFEEAGGTLRCEVPAAVPTVRADRQHLLNVLHNLLDNALKYTQGPPAARVRVTPTGRRVRL